MNDLSVHPSRKLSLTVGRDECLVLLNLERSKRIFYCRLRKEATLVIFDFNGDKFFMISECRIGVHHAEISMNLYIFLVCLIFMFVIL